MKTKPDQLFPTEKAKLGLKFQRLPAASSGGATENVNRGHQIVISFFDVFSCRHYHLYFPLHSVNSASIN